MEVQGYPDVDTKKPPPRLVPRDAVVPWDRSNTKMTHGIIIKVPSGFFILELLVAKAETATSSLFTLFNKFRRSNSIETETTLWIVVLLLLETEESKKNFE